MDKDDKRVLLALRLEREEGKEREKQKKIEGRIA